MLAFRRGICRRGGDIDAMRLERQEQAAVHRAEGGCLETFPQTRETEPPRPPPPGASGRKEKVWDEGNNPFDRAPQKPSHRDPDNAENRALESQKRFHMPPLFWTMETSPIQKSGIRTLAYTPFSRASISSNLRRLQRFDKQTPLLISTFRFDRAVGFAFSLRQAVTNHHLLENCEEFLLICRSNREGEFDPPNTQNIKLWHLIGRPGFHGIPATNDDRSKKRENQKTSWRATFRLFRVFSIFLMSGGIFLRFHW